MSAVAKAVGAEPNIYSVLRFETRGREVLSDDERTVIGYDGIEIYHRIVPEADVDAILEQYADDESIRSIKTMVTGVEAGAIPASPGLTTLVLKGLAVVEDFLPNIGRCALQDYGRLNDFCIEAGRVRRDAERPT